MAKKSKTLWAIVSLDRTMLDVRAGTGQAMIFDTEDNARAALLSHPRSNLQIAPMRVELVDEAGQGRK